jgi:hypothetical protein
VNNTKLETALAESLDKINKIEPEALRDGALRSINSYVQYIYATATGGAGPLSVPPSPSGGSTTTGTFKCPSCAYNGIATYT